MSFCVGAGYFPACISSEKINKIRISDEPPEMTLWEKIKEFFFSNHHSEALDCLFKLCHPSPNVSREEVESLFLRLKKLAAPGYKDNFCINGENTSEGIYYRITNKDGDHILSVFYGEVTVKNFESSSVQVMCLARTKLPQIC